MSLDSLSGRVCVKQWAFYLKGSGATEEFKDSEPTVQVDPG
jgi:hypothetical protein